MKTLAHVVTFLAATTLTVFAQGRVAFNNTNSFAPSNAITISSGNTGPAGGLAGQGIGGDKYTVQLVWSAGTGLSQAAFDAARTFGQLVTGVGATGSTTAAFFSVTGSVASGGGFFDAGSIPSPVGTTMPAGGYTMQVYAWYSGGGQTSFAQAVALGVNVGKSALFNMDVTASPSPVNSTIFPAFTVGYIPEPSSLVLAALGAVAMLLIRRKK